MSEKHRRILTFSCMRVFEDKFNLSGAICLRPPYRETPNLWEVADGLNRKERIERFEKAASLCRRCPALDECKARRDAFAEVGLSIDGVVAGEIPKGFAEHCRGCGIELSKEKRKPGTAKYWRSGYCRKCYAKARKKNKK